MQGRNVKFGQPRQLEEVIVLQRGAPLRALLRRNPVRVYVFDGWHSGYPARYFTQSQPARLWPSDLVKFERSSSKPYAPKNLHRRVISLKYLALGAQEVDADKE